jgi:signal transduction histidine kinase
VRVFPVLALGDEKTAIPFRLTTAQHVDIRNSYASGIEQLTNALFEYLGIELPDRTKGSAYEKDLLLLAKAIHDLKTPLATARGFTELLLMERYGLDESKKQAFLERVGKSLSRIASILDDLSELSRIRRHLLPVPEKPTDLNEIITAIVEEERIPADENNQTILLELQDQLAGIMLAPEQIRRLVLNLFTNAVKYTSPSGEIRLRTYQKDGFVFFAISDNGTGIPESLKPHLFEPFIRGKNSDQISGTGLGLTIVKEIVEVYDGKIDVESEEGEGTTFTISFRAADNPSAQSTPTH